MQISSLPEEKMVNAYLGKLGKEVHVIKLVTSEMKGSLGRKE